MQDSEANRHQLLPDIDPENSAEYEKFETKTIRNEVELAFFESHSDAEEMERLTNIFHEMAGYDIQTLFAHIKELQAKRLEAVPVFENATEDTEILSDKVRALMKRRFVGRAMASATIAAGTGGALIAQLMNFRF